MWQGVTVLRDTLHQPRIVRRRPERTVRHGDERTPVNAVERGVVIFAIIWQALTLFPDQRFWPGSSPSVLLSVLATAAWISWAALVLMTWGPWSAAPRRRLAQRVNALLVASFAVALLFVGSDRMPDGWIAAATVINLGVGMIGLSLPMAPAVVVGLVVVVLEAVGVELHAQGANATQPGAWLYAVYAAAIGVAVIGTRRGLLVAARSAEVAQGDAIRADAHARALRDVQRVVTAQARELHASVLNTLTAISRGLADSAAITLHARCASAVEVLDSLSQFTVPFDEPVLAAGVVAEQEALVAAGIAVEIAVTGDEDPPAEVVEAFTSAVREALSNIGRHARATHVSITGHRGGPEWWMRIDDDGIGFDPSSAEQRFGIADAIEGALSQVGGYGVVTSRPGEGTSVELRWRHGAQAASPSSWLDTGRLAMAASSLLAFQAFALASLVVSWSSYEFPGWAAGAFVLAISATGLTLLTAHRPLPPWVVLTVAVAASATYWLLQTGLGTAEPGPWADWGSESMLALLFVVAGLGPWWAGAAALASWLLTQGDILAELLRPGTAVIIAALFFARSLRANERAVSKAELERTVQLARGQAERDAMRHLSARFAGLSVSGARDLLQGILDGTADPDSEEVRAQCAIEEQFIRSVMRLDPESNALHAAAMQFAVMAYRRDQRMLVDIGDDVAVSAAGERALESLALLATEVFWMLDANEPARLTARREGDTVVVRFVGQLAEHVNGGALSGIDVPRALVDVADGTVLWEYVDA